MDTLLTSFRDQCLAATLDLLWRQWCSLGVAGHAQPANSHRLIDLEALVLATTSIGRHDPRLFDEALDWLSQYGTLVNLQRLKNLQKLHHIGDDRVICAIASWLVSHATQPRWKIFAQSPQPDNRDREPAPLFAGLAGSVRGNPDPTFLAHGLLRGTYNLRGMSRAAHPTQPPNLMVSLRALIGVSARVEIILYLTGSSTAAHATDIARATGYSPRTLQAVLQEMLISGHLLSQEPVASRHPKIHRGSNRRYHLQPDDWIFLSAGQPLPLWTPWAAIFVVTGTVLTAIPTAEAKSKHPAVISSQLRDALAQESPALAAAGFLPQLDLRAEAPGTELLQTLANRLPLLIASL